MLINEFKKNGLSKNILQQSVNKNDICAIVTTFLPDDRLNERVGLIQEQVGFVVIVDDGECNDNVLKLNKLFKGAKNVYVHHNLRNVGVATSLNTGISIAKERGYRWILTLDDDSLVNPNLVDRLINGLKNIKLNKPIGLIGMSWIAPYAVIKSDHFSNKVTYLEKRGIITSGSLFSMETYDKVGTFRDEFYIDSVDYDYCLRARKLGFAIIKLDEVGFVHSLGRSNDFWLMGLPVVVENHEAFRMYYWFRNSIVLALEYLRNDTLYSVAVLIAQTNKIIRILLFERDKSLKLVEAFRGVRDGLQRKLGKRIQAQ